MKLNPLPSNKRSNLNNGLTSCKYRSSLCVEKTWTLVDLPPLKNLVICQWVYKMKWIVDGVLERWKIDLVAQGFNQIEGINFGETFSPVIIFPTIRILISLVVSNRWTLRQHDIDNAFLNGDLKEEVYMAQPSGFIDKMYPNKVCHLYKSIYKLRQSPKACYEKLHSFLNSISFTSSASNPSLFIYKH